MNTTEVLNKAADLIIERGHSQGKYVCSNGAVCALGAIFIASGATVIEVGLALHLLNYDDMDVNVSEAARQQLRDYLYINDPNWNHASDSVPNWNDRSLTETVVSALRAAAQEEGK